MSGFPPVIWLAFQLPDRLAKPLPHVRCRSGAASAGKVRPNLALTAPGGGRSPDSSRGSGFFRGAAKVAGRDSQFAFEGAGQVFAVAEARPVGDGEQLVLAG